MTAFVSFIRAYAIWIYILCAFGIFLGIRMFVDARRLARTTLFSLEQERAGEQSYRAVGLIAVFLVAIGAVAMINVFISPLVPEQQSAILGRVTPTPFSIVLPSSTPTPTITPTLIKPTETPFLISTPTVVITPTRTPRPPLPTAVLTPTAAFSLPAPTIVGPLPNGGTWTGEGRKTSDLVFKWTWYCDQCTLGPNDRFVIVITYTDKFTGALKTISGGTQNNFLSLDHLIIGGAYEVYQKAQDDLYQWYVQVKRGEQPLSPPSETWKFKWK